MGGRMTSGKPVILNAHFVVDCAAGWNSEWPPMASFRIAVGPAIDTFLASRTVSIVIVIGIVYSPLLCYRSARWLLQ